MIRRSMALSTALAAPLVVAGSSPIHAADGSEVKRAIILTVLNNLGVQPTDDLVNNLVNDIPLDVLDQSLVTRVGRSLDRSEDPAILIGQTVDSSGDGIPDEDAATNACDDDGDKDNTSPGSSSGSGSTSSGNGSGTKPPKNDDESETGGNGSDNDDEGDESGDDEDN
jgi:hypothetical protein